MDHWRVLDLDMSATRTAALQRFASRYASFAAARIALVVGRWFVLIQSARHLAPVEFAALAAALSSAEILRALADSGADSFTYSRLGRAGNPVRITVRAALLFRLMLSVLVALAAGILTIRFSARPDLFPVFALIIATAVQSTSVVLLQKEARFSAMAILVAGTLLASIAVDLTAWVSTPALSTMAVLLVSPDIAAAVIAAMLASRSIAELVRQALRARRALMAQLRPIAAKLGPAATVSVLVIIYSRLDVMIVRPLAGSLEQAHYSAGFRLVEPAFLLFAIASLALLAELGAGRTNDVRSLAARLLSPPRSALLLGFPAICGLFVIAAMLVARHLIGLEPDASLLAGVFAAALPFRMANSTISALLLRFSRFEVVMQAAILNCGVTFGAAFVLVKPFGATGVAAAALLGEIVNTLFQRFRLQQQLARALVSVNERSQRSTAGSPMAATASAD